MIVFKLSIYLLLNSGMFVVYETLFVFICLKKIKDALVKEYLKSYYLVSNILRE